MPAVDDSHEHPHEHHGPADPAQLSTRQGARATWVSLGGLGATAAMQVVIFAVSGSVALLADTIHNFGDASTAIPLWIAFRFARLKPNRRFPYGYARVEDLAGAAIVFTILFSAIVAGYQSIDRLIHPRPVEYLWAVAAASIIGFIGNEGVAVFRIRVGKEIGSAALVADGYHARVDGLTSLAVLAGALGVWLGYPLADPLVGLGITAAILGIVWQSARAVFTRMLDGVDPGVIDELAHAAHHVSQVQDVTDVRARWLGHRLHAEVSIAVRPELSVADGHAVALDVHHQLLHHIPHLADATIHVDPLDAVGDRHHRVVAHSHDGLPAHSH